METSNPKDIPQSFIDILDSIGFPLDRRSPIYDSFRSGKIHALSEIMDVIQQADNSIPPAAFKISLISYILQEVSAISNNLHKHDPATN